MPAAFQSACCAASSSHALAGVTGPAKFDPNTALTLAMVFHELATNAMKHGALSIDDAGRIEIAWQVEPTSEGDRMRLRWLESGGPPVTPPSRKGFGSRLIARGLAKELDGEVRLDYEPAGMVCEIIMPAPPGVLNEQ